MENKQFDIIISPTDVLGEELQEILGGGSQCYIYCEGQCIGQCHENCKKVECNCQAKGQPAVTPADCPEGYTVIDGVCIELD